MNIQDRLTAFAMFGAGWVLWLLVGLSVFGLAIVLERAYYLLSSRDDITRLKNDMLRALRDKKYDEAKQLLTSSRSLEARVVSAGLDAHESGAAAAEDRMAGASQLAKIHMERNLAFLGTVGNNAPFIGLLGTVIGVIRAFQSLNESGGQVTSGLMADIGEALVATAIGILVALPAVAFFNLFQRVIRTRLGRADALGKELLAHLKSSATAAK